MERGLILLAAGAYFLATALWCGYLWQLRSRWQQLAGWSLAGGWLSHSGALGWQTWQQGFLPVANIGGALGLSSWLLVAALLLLWWRFPVKILGALAAPVAGLMLCGALILPAPEALPAILRSFWLTAHITTAMLGQALLALAFLAGILYLVQERQLKTKRFGFFYQRLPSLENLDTLNHACIKAGFVLLTLGIVTGSLYAQQTLGTFWRWDPKETLTLAAWLLYAVLLHERLVRGWRGRRAAWLAISGFLVLGLTFVGAEFWHHSYHRFGGFGKLP